MSAKPRLLAIISVFTFTASGCVKVDPIESSKHPAPGANPSAPDLAIEAARIGKNPIPKEIGFEWATHGTGTLDATIIKDIQDYENRTRSTSEEKSTAFEGMEGAAFLRITGYRLSRDFNAESPFDRLELDLKSSKGSITITPNKR